MRSFTRLARLQPTALAVNRNILTSTRLSQRAFSTTPRIALKEDHDRSGEELDRIKHEQLEKQKQGKGHWHEELASNSESVVAADKESVHDHESHIEDLQKETAKQHEKEQKS